LFLLGSLPLQGAGAERCRIYPIYYRELMPTIQQAELLCAAL
jgi:hypothetical protein